jgi:hypothetical protein
MIQPWRTSACRDTFWLIAAWLVIGIAIIGGLAVFFASPARAQDPSAATLAAIIAERDLRYGQRFEAQQRAVDAALVSVKEHNAAALVAAKEATAAALVAVKETSAAYIVQTNAHFAAINGLQAKLDKQAESFVSAKDLNVIADRLTRIEARGEGAGSTWVVIGAVVGPAVSIVALVVACFVAFRRRSPA